MPFSGYQFKIYSFQPGSLPASRVRTARSKQKQIFGVEVELAEYTINHHASEILMISIFIMPILSAFPAIYGISSM